MPAGRSHSDAQGRADGAAWESLLWPSDRHLLNVRFLDGDSSEKRIVKHLVKKHYNSLHMRITFKFLDEGAPGPSDIRITFGKVLESYIGRQAEDHPGKPTMWLNLHLGDNLGTEARRLRRQADILHEFGHALGMIHEHQHPDCKANWNYRVLQARSGWDTQKVHRNYDRVDQGVKLAPYDPESIMHYPIRRGDTHSAVMSVPLNSVLSEGDEQFLMSVYPVKRTSKPKSVPKPTRKATKKSDTSLDRKLELDLWQDKKPEPKWRPKLHLDRCSVTVSDSGSIVSVNIGGSLTTGSCSSSTVFSNGGVVKSTRSGCTVVKGGSNYVKSTGSGHTIVKGSAGHVKSLGSGNTVIKGNGGWVEAVGSGYTVVDGDSSVRLTGSGTVWVNGSGTAVVIGSGSVSFTGKGSGTVIGSGSIRSNVENEPSPRR